MIENAVVVGYDKSPNSERALREAARAAEAGGRTLTIVHAFRWLPPITPIAVPTDDAEKACRKAAQQVVEDAAAIVRSRHPGLKVEARAVDGSAASVLTDVSHDAGLLVVGNRGHGGFTGLLLGSVSIRVLTAAACPVIVVRGESRPTLDRILAGVDIDGPCDEQLAFAFSAAAQRGASLAVLHLWDEPWFLAYNRPGAAEDTAAIEADRTARLAAVVACWQAKFPDVPVTQKVLIASAAARLVEESASSDLLVVGGRRNAGRAGVIVGPVSNTVLHHSACPVAVVPCD
jgi:nucleotide-binding universal stress UspA family protein